MNTMVMLVLIFFHTMGAMDDDKPYKPAAPMIHPEIGQGYLKAMPIDVQKYIIITLTTLKTLEEVANAIRAYALVNAEFNRLINDPVVMRNIIHLLVDKFGDDPATVAEVLNTSGAREYVTKNRALLQGFTEHCTLHKAKSLVKEGADINFFDGLIKQGFLATTVVKNMPSVLKYFVTEQANLNQISKRGFTLLMLCVQQISEGQRHVSKSSIELLELLLSSMHYDVINSVHAGDTALDLAITARLPEIVYAILQAGGIAVNMQALEVLHARAKDRPQDQTLQEIAAMVPKPTKKKQPKKAKKNLTEQEKRALARKWGASKAPPGFDQ